MTNMRIKKALTKSASAEESDDDDSGANVSRVDANTG